MIVRHRRGNAKEERGSFDWLVKAGVERLSKDKAGMFELIDLDRSRLPIMGGAGKRHDIDKLYSKSKQLVPETWVHLLIPHMIVYDTMPGKQR